MQLVVANELHSRKDRVWLVQQAAADQVRSAAAAPRRRAAAMPAVRLPALAGGPATCLCVSRFRPTLQGGGMAVHKIERPPHVAVIEMLLVGEVVGSHRRFMAAAAAAASQRQQHRQGEQQQRPVG